MKEDLLNFISNKVFFYLSSRYATFILQFVVSLLLSARLGPHYLGVWGVYIVIHNYYYRLNLGIPYSSQVMLIQNLKDRNNCNLIYFNSLIVTGFLILIVAVCTIILGSVSVSYFDKYNISWQLYVLAAIACIEHVNYLLISVFRVNNQIYEIAFQQSITVVFQLVVLFFAQGEHLVIVLLFALLVSALSSLFLLLCRNRMSVKGCHVDKTIIKELLNKGYALFFYNTCFYFIMMSLRTIISSDYSPEEFGNFTFAYTLSNAIMLLVEALIFLVSPKMISMYASADLEKIRINMRKIRFNYITLIHLLMYMALVVFPYVKLLFKQYTTISSAFIFVSLILMTQSFNMAFAQCLIARNKEKKAALSSLIALAINLVVGALLSRVFHVEYQYVMLSSVLSMMVFSILLFVYLKEEIGLTWKRDTVSWRLLVPYLVFLATTIVGLNVSQYMIVIFLLLNLKEIKKIGETIFLIFNKPNIVNV
ncbi:lipopolysaccharide biosynthesis protein [Parabacteroides distasonis]|uniref:Polysaccharide biosynthesis protein n=1 Tax=Parabacteroides distasonis TaxID=823 RepID=A0A174QS32_PARDI|nr:polysaccharide biosynthesis C-terminal domain-containing protein [Parabacteroides distasonis]KAA4325785.1 hypothetical protein F3C88_25865 [Bacteroides ovatus]MRY83609.1 hypothetical protein [Parabacteroides distasonis]MRZ06900.1 hypothetical protein [Parabacteroides distasonis]CUP76032.1 Polysaccharide biosynthesis protein [Parabacteroides distasonis]